MSRPETMEISPEIIKQSIWDNFQAIKDLAYKETARRIQENIQQDSYEEPRYSDELKKLAFLRIKLAIKHLTSEQRQTRKETIEQALKNLEQGEKEGTQKASEWQLKKEFWQLEIEAITQTEKMRTMKQNELAELQKVIQTIESSLTKKLLEDQIEKLKNGLEEKPTLEDMNDMSNDLSLLKKLYKEGPVKMLPKMKK